MQLTNNTILITGGATGIGLALAAAFLQKGNTVIVCGRRETALHEAQRQFPALITIVADVATPTGRTQLANWVKATYPALNVLVNNAGIQREFSVDNLDVAAQFDHENEIETNLTAPIHLTFLLMPHLLRQPQAAVINVSSGLGYVPKAIMPVYCATKAALISFSTSLRLQLKGTTVQVFDVAPPIVETDLDQGARARRDQLVNGILPKQVADETLVGLARNQFNIAIDKVKLLKLGSRIAPGGFLKIMNKA